MLTLSVSQKLMLSAFELSYCDRSNTTKLDVVHTFIGHTCMDGAYAFFLDLSVDSEHFESVGKLRRKHREGDISPKY